jgi:5-(carboxyamino)imidazole ribonucleotide synthase
LVRPGRKIGHVNVVGRDASQVEDLRRRADRVASIIRDGVDPQEGKP